MTPLKRLEVSGPGALDLLQRLTTGEMDKSVGAVTYTLALDEAGGIRSDLTVARLGATAVPGRGQRPPRPRLLLRQAPADGTVQIRDITGGTCCIGLWGPRARDLVQPLSPDDFSNDGLKYFRAQAGTDRGRAGDGDAAVLRRRARLGDLHQRRQRSAAVGRAVGGRPGPRRDRRRPGGVQQPSAGEGLPRLGPRHDHRAQPLRGRSRLRRPRRRRTTSSAGGVAGLSDDTVGRRLSCLTIDDGRSVVLGHEPVFVDGQPAGYVTSAAFGHTVGRPIAYAWLPALRRRRHGRRDRVLRQPHPGDRRRRTARRPRDEPDPRLTGADRSRPTTSGRAAGPVPLLSEGTPCAPTPSRLPGALAARVPAPGGGATAGLHAAQAAALVAMVARYSDGAEVRRPRRGDHALTTPRTGSARRRCALAEDDAAAFTAVTQAYGLPKGDPRRGRGSGPRPSQAGLVAAAHVPATVIAVAERVLSLAEQLLPIGNRNVISDVAAAAEAARAAATTARVNIEINLGGITDPASAASCCGRREPSTTSSCAPRRSPPRSGTD